MMVMDGVKKSSIHNLRYEPHETLSKLLCICVYVESIVASEILNVALAETFPGSRKM